MHQDFVRDANPRPLYKAGIHADLPDYVKNYEIPSEEQVEKLASSAFADTARRLHPVHTPEAVILSGIYLHGSGGARSEAMEHVKRAAAVHGVSEDLDKVLSQLEGLDKQASQAPRKEYAMLVEDSNEKIVALYPINNDVQVCKSAQTLHDDFLNGKIPSDWAHSAAQRIVKKANELGLDKNDMPERIWVLGTDRLPDYDVAMKMARLRDYDGVTEEAGTLYQDLVKAASEDRDNLDEYVKLWADLDMSHGISYKNTFTPQEAFYTGVEVSSLEKMATQVVVVSGVMVPKEEFLKVSSERIRRSFREEMADVVDSIVKLADTDPAMATKYAEALDRENRGVLLDLLLDNEGA